MTSKTQALHATCESLLTEQHSLEAQVKALSGPLQRFGALDELGPALGLPFHGSSRGSGGISGSAAVGGVGGMGVPLRRSSSGGGGSGAGSGGRVLLNPGSDEFAQVSLRFGTRRSNTKAMCFNEAGLSVYLSPCRMTEIRVLLSLNVDLACI